MFFLSENNRGVTYVVWDNYNKGELNRSIESVKKQGYEVHVQNVHNTYPGLSKKGVMMDVSPFDTTLYLDTDTVVHGNLDYGFKMAEAHGLACVIAPASSAYHAGPNEMRDLMDTDLPQYNTGVIFFMKDWKSDFQDREYPVKDTFERWKELMIQYPESSAKNDQIGFSVAVSESINPYILPRTWNLRRGIRYEAQITHGEIKIIHSKK